jgi:hypothetical protein
MKPAHNPIEPAILGERVRDELRRTHESGKFMTHFLLVNCVPLTATGTQNEARLTAELRSMLNNRTFVMNSATPSLMPMFNGQLEESNVYMRWVSEEGCRIVYHTNSAVSTANVALLTRKLVTDAYAVALRRTGTPPPVILRTTSKCFRSLKAESYRSPCLARGSNLAIDNKIK